MLLSGSHHTHVGLTQDTTSCQIRIPYIDIGVSFNTIH